ncbi:MAG: 3-phosphoshikimate 1-carboxyvinyltransferase [Muribaculaceae bacterium]|nr:3-phosphoshikimate 1-carboxyvinyltransferase [Muribaculaceae bacterium]
MSVRIFPPEEMLETSVSLPLSKSISTRALIMAYLTPGVSVLPTEGISQCTDTAILRHCLENPSATVNVGAAGTSMRFLTALYASMPGREITLDGSERMRRRPVGPLVDALRQLGARIDYLEEEGFAPLRISGRRLSGGRVEMDASASSQYVSGLMMVAPMMEQPLEIHLTGGGAASSPYIRMTAEMMCRRGVEAELEGYDIRVPNTPYLRTAQDAESDWSAATFWYEIAALTAGWVTIAGLRADALQGDRGVEKIFNRLGVQTEYTAEGAELSALPDVYARIDGDMSDMPDAVPSIAVTAAMLGIPFRLSGVEGLKIKECDRLAALRNELLKFGIILESEAESGAGVLAWEGARAPIRALPVVNTYDDHRIAMAFAPAAVFVPGVVIENSGVVDKSYPGFWDALREAGFIVQPADAPIPEAYRNTEAE